MTKVTQQSDTDEAWPQIPGYKILGVAGEGGMGRVYRAEQVNTRRQVAIKVLPAKQQDRMIGRSMDPLAVFTREAKTVASLEHPFILPVYDFGEYEDQPYLVMRYLDGGTIADKIREQGRIQPSLAYRWVQQIADALDYAQQQGVIHKDVKPSNMLLDESNNAYLMDFGIAGLETGEGKMGIGSASYMPPEQSMGEELDGRVDVYALAVSLFEMVTGQKPYQAETTMGVIVRHMHDPIPSPHLMNSDISHAVSTLIQWGMAKAPDNRPSSPAEFASLLAVAQANPEVSLRSMPELKAMAVNLDIKLDDKLIMETATGLRPVTTEVSDTIVMPGALEMPEPVAQGNRVMLAIVSIIGLLLISAAIFAVSGGPSVIASSLFPSPTPLPTATKLATATPPPTVTPTPQGRLIVDDFSDRSSNFAVAPGEDVGINYEDGQLVFRAQRAAQFFSFSEVISATNVVVEVTAVQMAGSAAADAGIVCRQRDNQNYTALAISRQGIAIIWQEQNNEQAILAQETVDFLETPLNVERELRAICDGQTLRLFVGGALVVEAVDPEPIGGYIGFVSRLRDSSEDASLVVAFDDLLVSEP